MNAAATSRRDFLQAAAAGATGLMVPGGSAGSSRSPLGQSCIFINLVGGPSHLDTFDPKPNAPSDIRGPFRPIRTNVPGLHLSELFPNLAKVADKFTLIRGMHHDAPPIHEAGLQLLNSGHLFRDGPARPNVGAVLSHLLGANDRMPPWWHLSDGEITTGIAIGHGQDAGFLPLLKQWPVRPKLQGLQFEMLCHLAVRAVATKARFVNVNMYSTVFDSPSWDCHADRGSLRTDLNDIRDTVATSFDRGFSRLLIELEELGLLASTLVIATGELGRTPKFNANGGRDHWSNCWTAIVAGGGVTGGRIVGASDAIGSEPSDRPTTPQELVATIYRAMGIPTDATIPGPTGQPVPVYPGRPIAELFA
jgi:hypothetical protein